MTKLSIYARLSDISDCIKTTTWEKTQKIGFFVLLCTCESLNYSTMADDYVRNAWDTHQQRSFAFSAENLRSGLVSRRLTGTGYFTAGVNRAALPTIMYMYGVGRCTGSQRNVGLYARIYAALEMVSPCLPDDSFVPDQHTAERVMLSALLEYFVRNRYDNNMLSLVRPGTDAERAQAGINLSAQQLLILVPENPPDTTAAWLELIRTLAAQNVVHIALTTLCQVIDFSFNINHTPFANATGANLYALVYVAMGKRGTISDNKLTKIKDDLKIALRKDIYITSDEINAMFRELRGLINGDNAEAILTGMAGDMTDFNLRLRLTVDQAMRSGMTSYWSIRTALTEFPDFPWAEAQRYIPGDFARYREAFTVVGENQYYGFNENLGVAASTRYRSLGWLAMHLLVAKRGAEYGSLRNYATYSRGADHQNQLQELINQYEPGIAPLDEAAYNTFRADIGL